MLHVVAWCTLHVVCCRWAAAVTRNAAWSRDRRVAVCRGFHGTARHGTARHGTARHGTARHGTARLADGTNGSRSESRRRCAHAEPLQPTLKVGRRLHCLCCPAVRMPYANVAHASLSCGLPSTACRSSRTMGHCIVSHLGRYPSRPFPTKAACPNRAPKAAPLLEPTGRSTVGTLGTADRTDAHHSTATVARMDGP